MIASLQETSVAPSVRRAAEDLSLGFIAPIADGGTADLAQRQNIVMANVRNAVEAQSQALSQAADEILNEPAVENRRFVPLSSAEAVIRYASDFLPSWAGAISIDLLPAALVFILAIAQGYINREGVALEAAERVTAAEMFRAVELYRQMTQSEEKRDEEAAPDRSRDVAEGGEEAEVPKLVRPVDPEQMRRIKDRA